ncbi:MAG: hypothetical protein ACR2KU_05790 [Gammaproteobacteria bacterium]
MALKTFVRYAEICRRHLIPALGHDPLVKLSPLHIEGHYAKARPAFGKDFAAAPPGTKART